MYLESWVDYTLQFTAHYHYQYVQGFSHILFYYSPFIPDSSHISLSFSFFLAPPPP